MKAPSLSKCKRRFFSWFRTTMSSFLEYVISLRSPYLISNCFWWSPVAVKIWTQLFSASRTAISPVCGETDNAVGTKSVSITRMTSSSPNAIAGPEAAFLHGSQEINPRILLDLSKFPALNLAVAVHCILLKFSIEASKVLRLSWNCFSKISLDFWNFFQSRSSLTLSAPSREVKTLALSCLTSSSFFPNWLWSDFSL